MPESGARGAVLSRMRRFCIVITWHHATLKHADLDRCAEGEASGNLVSPLFPGVTCIKKVIIEKVIECQIRNSVVWLARYRSIVS